MRRKSIVALALAATMTSSMSMTAYAGSWEQAGTDWKYADNGTYMTGWQWIDENNDGVAECYYFDGNGYMLANTTTPDGYTVDASGAWTVNGVVRTKVVTDTTQMTQGNENVSVPSGYNENGVSNLAIDILEHTRAENAAKYGENDAQEMAGEYHVYYDDLGFLVEYQYNTMDEKPSRVRSYANQADRIFKDAPMTGNAYDNKDTLRSKGYSAVTDGGITVVDLGRYEGQLQGKYKWMELYIKFSYTY